MKLKIRHRVVIHKETDQLDAVLSPITARLCDDGYDSDHEAREAIEDFLDACNMVFDTDVCTDNLRQLSFTIVTVYLPRFSWEY